MMMQEYRIRILIAIILTISVLYPFLNDFIVKRNNEEVVFIEIVQLSTDGWNDFIEIVDY
ncbi:MAG: hypothetical protein ACFFB5_13690 [Promethearchaeota archaeon]